MNDAAAVRVSERRRDLYPVAQRGLDRQSSVADQSLSGLPSTSSITK